MLSVRYPETVMHFLISPCGLGFAVNAPQCLCPPRRSVPDLVGFYHLNRRAGIYLRKPVLSPRAFIARPAPSLPRTLPSPEADSRASSPSPSASLSDFSWPSPREVPLASPAASPIRAATGASLGGDSTSSLQNESLSSSALVLSFSSLPPSLLDPVPILYVFDLI